jgi:hypothetical protein
MRRLLATATVVIIAGGIALSIPASATDLTFTVQGTVTSFIDVDNVYGFGAGANLAGLAVTDVYTIDLSNSTLSSGVPYGPGSAYHAYCCGFGSASSTIGGNTITFSLTNGYELSEYNDQIVSPPGAHNRTLLELQAIGAETTGNDVGAEFLIRDEVVSYSLAIPLTLNGLNLSTLDFGGAASEGSGVFFPYAQGATAGFWDLTLNNSAPIPEPATWAMMLVGFTGLCFAGFRKAKISPLVA